MDKKNYLKISLLTIFLWYFFIAYPITYFLIKTPYINCSNFFIYYNEFFHNEAQRPNCITITESDLENIFHIFFYGFAFLLFVFLLLTN